jgi:hypothetical protein
MYEAVTKIIMDMENCSYGMTTGIGLGIDVTTKTPYGMECYSRKKAEKRTCPDSETKQAETANTKRMLPSKGKTPNRFSTLNYFLYNSVT